jgi:Tfp pilus assembly protein PilV
MRREDGFTIISVLVAIVMLSIGILALSRSGTQAIAAQTLAGNRTTALAIGRAYMEAVRSRPPAQVQSESAVKVDETGTVNPNGVFTRSVAVTVVRHNLKEVRVVVEFPRSNVPIELLTLAYVGNF